MKFSDETLLAYLEGNAEEGQAEAIEAAVADDPTLESRLMALDPLAPVVHRVFSAVPSEAPKVELPEPQPSLPSAAGAGVMRLLAVAASVSVIAVSATFWATRPAELGWAQQAAIYQSLYTPDTISDMDDSPAALDAQFAKAEAQLGRSLNRDVLEDLPGLDLKRAQVLSFKGKPLVQVVFADAEGRPFAFCVIKQGDAAQNTEVAQAVLSGLATAKWTQDGYGYMLLGGDDQADLTNELDTLRGVFTG
ncbi:hypothetical protein RA28_08275 [Ruegeria sp. ANG-S4]|uniref:hypothetical protein n=1 Tax=Ruegeria sp. ANG-S4 TaxID=1577904 RepID=UPI00057F8C6F|nr:hypothetical protein [Ruegeria sp. ANG-S4]KIC45698.1 hypothetical protein RA28_08275 [Ruegeria sp. ANG-S4]